MTSAFPHIAASESAENGKIGATSRRSEKPVSVAHDAPVQGGFSHEIATALAYAHTQTEHPVKTEVAAKSESPRERKEPQVAADHAAQTETPIQRAGPRTVVPSSAVRTSEVAPQMAHSTSQPGVSAKPAVVPRTAANPGKTSATMPMAATTVPATPVANTTKREPAVAQPVLGAKADAAAQPAHETAMAMAKPEAASLAVTATSTKEGQTISALQPELPDERAVRAAEAPAQAISPQGIATPPTVQAATVPALATTSTTVVRAMSDSAMSSDTVNTQLAKQTATALSPSRVALPVAMATAKMEMASPQVAYSQTAAAIALDYARPSTTVANTKASQQTVTVHPAPASPRGLSGPMPQKFPPNETARADARSSVDNADRMKPDREGERPREPRFLDDLGASSQEDSRVRSATASTPAATPTPGVRFTSEATLSSGTVKAQLPEPTATAQSSSRFALPMSATSSAALPARNAKTGSALSQAATTQSVADVRRVADQKPLIALPPSAAPTAAPLRLAKEEAATAQTISSRSTAAPATTGKTAFADVIVQPAKTNVVGQPPPAVPVSLPMNAASVPVSQSPTSRARATMPTSAAPLVKVAMTQAGNSALPEADATTRLIADGATLGHAWRETTAAAAVRTDNTAAQPQPSAHRLRSTAAANPHEAADATTAPAATGTFISHPSMPAKAATEARLASTNTKDAQPMAASAELKSRMDVAAPNTSTLTATAHSRLDEMSQRVEQLQKVAEQFAQSVSTLGQKNGGSMTIELTPASLGKMTVDCDVKNGAMTLKLVAESDAARNVLADHAQAIRDVVQNAGYELAQFNVQTRSEWADQRQANPRQAGDTRREKKVSRETTTATAAVAGTTAGARYDDGQEHAVWLVA